MSNNNTWPDPDTQLAGHGRKDVVGVYLVDPATNKAYAASGGSGGAITNDGTFAKETGGNLATLVTQTSGLATASNQATSNTNTANTATGIGGVADSAANNSTSSWSLIALLKGLYTLLTATLAMNVSKWNGSTPGAGNPVITEEQIRAYILAGQGFTAYINGNVTAAQAAGVSLYFSNPSKNILIYRVTTGAATAGSNCKLAKSSSDFALGAGGAAANNLNLNSGTSSIVTAITSSITTTSSGTIFDYTLLPSEIETEVLANSEVIYIPSGTYNVAFAAFCNLVGSNGAGFVSISWLEI